MLTDLYKTDNITVSKGGKMIRFVVSYLVRHRFICRKRAFGKPEQMICK